MTTSVYNRYNKNIGFFSCPVRINKVIQDDLTSVFNYLKRQEFLLPDEKSLEIDKVPHDLYENENKFNPVDIAAISNDPEKLLDDVEIENRNYYDFTYGLKKRVSNSFSIVPKLQRIHNDFYDYEMFNRNLKDYNFFRFMNYEVEDVPIDFSDKSSMSIIISSIYFYEFIENSLTESQAEFIDKIDSEFDINEMKTALRSFMENNIEMVSNDIMEFLVYNILLLENVSDNTKQKIKEEIKPLFETDIPNLFDEFFNEKGQQHAFKVLGSSIFNDIKARMAIDFTSKNEWDYHQFLFIDENGNEHNDDKMKEFENEIFDFMKEKLRKKKRFDLIQLEYLTYQYNNRPLDFINAHYIIYNQWNKTLKENHFLREEDFFNLAKLNRFLKGVDITDKSGVKDAIGNYSISNMVDNENVIQSAMSKYLMSLFEEFINTDKFQQFITETFVPKIGQVLNDVYPNGIDIVLNNMYRVLFQFKILSFYYIGTNQIYNSQKSKYENILKNLTNDSPTPLDVNFPSLINTTRITKINYIDFIEDFYLAGALHDVVERIISKYKV